MSDYGDDYSDDGEEWFYVEEEFMAADDLAEHAVASPPPTTYADEDAAEDWDRFDYFNDLEYASDGYDDAAFQTHSLKGAKTGEKRKRHVKPTGSKKRQRSLGDTEASALGMAPIVWRSQTDRGLQPKLLGDDAQTYTVLRDWRKKLRDTPLWARGPSPQSPPVQAAREPESIAEGTSTVEPASPPCEIDVEDEGAPEDETDIDPGALMAVLQSRLAEAGGPLSGMDPQQLLDFAMRMAAGKDAGDDIAGEMADAMLDHGEAGDEEDSAAEANLLSWVAQQRNSGTEPPASAPSSTTTIHSVRQPPTLPNEETGTRASSRTLKASQTVTKSRPQNTSALKRKTCDDDEVEASTKPSKKRATRTFDAPTAASQARTAPPKNTKGGRKK
ncbi:uncharacterized protein EKO05_0000328 [Ascochyta rabiei]|uniref:Uncharacterized protein n=1 Tax=Didymella rabiei TaxID=5454 RepID=A0A162VBW6_DIDRA|nr:uncharacterized protein EKO05_0000328 [Ascochyta rabiei]KZM18351.1 hypothetical protein ST47_g10468 [Ascochyta rabiei]UPX09643.1 hypothetical protein EKO05_0000328 [Ascochyta rabiei]